MASSYPVIQSILKRNSKCFKENIKKKFKFYFISFLLSACAQLPMVSKGQSKMTTSTTALNVKKFILGNGLTILVAPNPKLPIASYYTLFDVGGRYEVKGTTGATHF